MKHKHKNLKLTTKFPFLNVQNKHDGYPALPPGIPSEEDLELNPELTAQQLLGIRVIPTNDTEESVPAVFKGQKDYGVAVHLSNYHLQPYVFSYTDVETGKEQRAEVPGLFALAQTGNYDWRLYLSAHKPDSLRFSAHINYLKQKTSPHKREFLEEIEKWGSSNNGGVVRNLWIIGPSEFVVPRGDNPKGSLRGRVVDNRVAGSALYNLIHRKPARFVPVAPDANSGRRYHARYAVPKQLIKQPRFLEIGNMAYAYWAFGQITLQNFEALLKKNVDIFLRLELIRGTYNAYITPLLRSSAPLGKLDSLENLDGELSDISNWERLVGEELMTAFHSLIPGGPDLPSSFGRHSVPGWQTVFQQIADSLTPVGDPQGWVVLGLNNGVPYKLDPTLWPSWLYTGPSKKAGKSTTFPVHTTQETLVEFCVDLTASRLDSARIRIKEEGGKIIKLDLPDASLFLKNQDPHKKWKPEEIKENQLKLHQLNIEEAKQEVDELEAEWDRFGYINRSVTFDIVSGNSLRFLDYVDQFLTQLRERIINWHARSGQYVILVIDNWSHLTKLQKSHPILGSLPWDTAVNLAQTIGWFINQGANNGIRVRIITHHKNDFAAVLGGETYKSFTLHIDMGLDTSHTARLIIPQTEEIMAEVSMHLPYPVRRFTERLQPEDLKVLEEIEEE